MDGGAEAGVGPAVTTVPPRGAPAGRIAGVAPRRLLVQHTTVWIGLDNYRQILSDPTFWTITLRTFGFTIANVALTLLVGTAVALLLGAVSRWIRLALSIALILAWATPVLTASVIFQWLFDSKFGVVNWALTSVGIFGDWTNHSWFDTGLSTFFV